MFEKIYYQTAEIFPPSAVEKTRELLQQGGIEKISPKVYLGLGTYLSTALALIAFFLAPIFVPGQHPAAYVGIAVAVQLLAGILFYLNLTMTAENRAEKIEAMLPEMLQIISANIRAGMTLENAVWSSAREEFGPLRDEIKKVSADAYRGIPIQDGMLNMSKRIRSTLAERAIKLIVEGIAKGGEMTRLLDRVAWDLKSAQTLRKEITTATLTYSLFIVFAAVIVSPLLFSVSTYYSEMNEKIAEKTTASPELNMSKSVRGGPMTYSAIPIMGFGQRPKDMITSNEIKLFAYAAIIITTAFSALLLGVIRYGKPSKGLKFLVLFVVLGLAVFSLAHDFLTAAFSSIMR